MNYLSRSARLDRLTEKWHRRAMRRRHKFSHCLRPQSNPGQPQPPIMNAYEFDISRADCARDLNQLWNDIEADENLNPEEKTDLCRQIRERLFRLNAGAPVSRKPRW